MKVILFATLLLGLFLSCNNSPSRTANSKLNQNCNYPTTSSQSSGFINWWITAQKDGPIALIDKLRNKTLNLLDAKELKKYLRKEKKDTTIFGNIEDSIKFMEYKQFDPKLISAEVIWVNHEQHRECRKISKKAMWDCLWADYKKKDYYYLSEPIFSIDGKWAVMSVNYMEINAKKSCGGGRLFKQVSSNQWEEVALLTGWGNFN